jgi:hypothetical protein
MIILAYISIFFIFNQSAFSSSGRTSKNGKAWGFVQALISLRAVTQATALEAFGNILSASFVEI